MVQTRADPRNSKSKDKAIYILHDRLLTYHTAAILKRVIPLGCFSKP